MHHPLGDHLADALQQGACAGSGEVQVGSSDRRWGRRGGFLCRCGGGGEVGLADATAKPGALTRDRSGPGRRPGGGLGDGGDVAGYHATSRAGACGNGRDVDALGGGQVAGTRTGTAAITGHGSAGGRLHRGLGARDGGVFGNLLLRGAETHLREHGSGILTGFPDHEKGLHDGDIVALGPQQLQHGPGCGAGHLHGGLVGLHLAEDAVLGDGVALLDQPGHDETGLDAVPEGRHDYDGCHLVSPRRCERGCVP